MLLYNVFNIMDSTYTPTLYLPEKYRVFSGPQTNVALCTCWADPTLLIHKYDQILKTFSITGTLYSREGVSILIRNLCLNPTIDTVIIWANNPLSKTAIGSAGRNALCSLWKHGVDAQHTIVDTGVKLHKEIETHYLDKLRKSVHLVDMSDSPMDDVFKESIKLTKSHLQPYMKSVFFPEPKREKMPTMPSEKVGWSIHAKKTTDAWVKVVDKIIRYGDVKKTESGSGQKELQHISWTISNETIDQFHIPDWPAAVKEQVGLNPDMLNQYKQIFLTGDKPADSAYTYGNRLYSYPGPINQMQHIIEKLRLHRETRRAYATTFYPPTDHELSSPPCLTSIQFLTTPENQLNMFATFRSHDIFKAALPNAFGLLHLQQYVAGETQLRPGSLTIDSVSAHIYEEDWQMATDTLKCALWERTKLYFDENEDIDPRGLMRISVQSTDIHVELQNEQADILFEYTGKSAREVALKIARLDLLSMPAHYVDVCIELTKAEIAIKTENEYIQDRPLKVGSSVIK